MVAIITKDPGKPAVAHIGIAVTFDPMNGGWLTWKKIVPGSVSVPIRRVQEVYLIESGMPEE